MPVNVTFSKTAGGVAIADSLQGGGSGLDHGNVTNGSSTGIQEVFIRHNGANEITDCKFWIAPYSGVYGGGTSASLDLAEILSWGVSNEGLRIDPNPDSIFTSFKTGVGDSSINAIALSGGDGGTNPDDIGAGMNTASIKLRVSVPPSEDTAGYRQFDFKMDYTYTS